MRPEPYVEGNTSCMPQLGAGFHPDLLGKENTSTV